MPPTPLTPRQSKLFVILLFILPALLTWILLALFGRSSTIDTKKKETKADITFLAAVLDSFKFDTGRYPTTTEGLNALITNPNLPKWNGPYLMKPINDPWGSPYLYQFPGKPPTEFTLSSNGPDKLPHTPDDIKDP